MKNIDIFTELESLLNSFVFGSGREIRADLTCRSVICIENEKLDFQL